MSYRLRRKSRPQGDVEIYGGPLKQKSFKGGMNLDVPASEIKADEVAYASNVIFREFGFEARAGSIQVSQFSFADINTASNFNAYCSNPLKFGTFGVNYRNAICYNSQVRYYGENPASSIYVAPGSYDYTTNVTIGAHNPGTGDTTMIPYRRGFMIFNAAKISYTEFSGAFVVNSPNPVHGIKDDNASGAFKYRYLLTLSRCSIYSSDGTVSTYTATDRNTAGAELVHESGSNGARYNLAGTSTARQTDYGEVFRATAISASSSYALTNADLKAAFSTAADVTNDLAAAHFTHVTIWRTCDFGDAGIALGNDRALFYWVADVKRSDVIGVGAGFTDVFSDASIQNNNVLLKTQGFDPMPSGSCAELAGGWMFVADRTNATSENYLNYCAISNSPENIGYYFGEVQKWRFNQGIRAMRANQDILSIFCESSSHICNMTSYVSSPSKVQSVPFLNYFHAVDRSIGIKDWATLDSIDENTFIAVCSDNSVRQWDTTKWGDDLAYEKVSTEIRQIVPASVNTYERGSVGKYYNGAYYLWYSKDLTDTATTKCLRYGFGKKAGYGWSFYEGTAFPNFKRGVQVVDETQGVQRLIVIRGTNGKFIWVDTFKPFVGAVDDTNIVPSAYQMDRCELDLGDYPNGSGTEIASTVKFRELIGNSESDVLVHDETFHRWRPLSESVGYRSGLSISMSAYKDGSTTAYETITEQPRTGALKFTKEVAARRVQLAVSTDVGSWRYVGIDSSFRSLDKINYATAGDNSSSESTTSYPQFQSEWAQDLDFWLTRREEGLDRATGVQMDPVYAGAITMSTGPDSKSSSAYSFSAIVTNAHDYTEAWTATNSYWTYDGDQDFATYPGYLATSASGSAPVFNGGTLFTAFPLSLATYPFKMRHKLRVLSANSTNTAFCIFDVAEDAGFVGDFVEFIFQYQQSTQTYYIEVLGTKSGNPTYDVLTDLNIARTADSEFWLDFEINSTGWKFAIPDNGIYMSDTGWSFSTVGFMDVNVQRTDANNQGMLAESRIWTDAPGSSDARYDEDFTESYTGDFTASFWVKGASYNRDIMRVDGTHPMYFQLTDSTHLDVCGLDVVTLTAVGSGWNHFFIRRVGTSVTVYQNDVLKGTITDSGPTTLGGGSQIHVGPTNGAMQVADVRIKGDDISADAKTYYYNNVISEHGDMVMPQV